MDIVRLHMNDLERRVAKLDKPSKEDIGTFIPSGAGVNGSVIRALPAN